MLRVVVGECSGWSAERGSAPGRYASGHAGVTSRRDALSLALYLHEGCESAAAMSYIIVAHRGPGSLRNATATTTSPPSLATCRPTSALGACRHTPPLIVHQNIETNTRGSPTPNSIVRTADPERAIHPKVVISPREIEWLMRDSSHASRLHGSPPSSTRPAGSPSQLDTQPHPPRPEDAKDVTLRPQSFPLSFSLLLSWAQSLSSCTTPFPSLRRLALRANH